MVPSELTAYPQWILWREVIKPDGDRTKLPYSITGNLASVTDPRTWTSYHNAVEASKRLCMGIGFVLTVNDPFAFIDLDDPGDNQELIARHKKILESFDSYAEVSPSGKGIHIIVKGAVDKGRRRDKVEVYSAERYMTVTGWTLHQKPIEERTMLLDQLWRECGGANGNGNYVIEEKDETLTDRQLYDQAKDAENGEKFLALWQGRWMEAGYPSQSEADFALINILSFYSRNVTQIKRMFFMSALGQRDKAKRKAYIENMVKRSFDNAVPYIPLEQVTAKMQADLASKNGEVAANPFAGPLFQNVPDQAFDWTMPPGLMGDIADYIYRSAPRPVKEIALAGAIGLMAGVCGRAYNISGTGLNQYVLLLAGTGTGKEAMASGIEKLMRYIRLKVPAAMDFVGPSEIASGPALTKYLGKHPCFVSIVGEFGLTLQAMCAYNANGAQIMLRKRLLELYNKSGEKDVLQPTIYSDKEKNTQILRSPSFTLLGESTPDSYYGGLDETMIAQGLLPRFLCIEYLGPRPMLNVQHDSIEPNAKLVEQIGELAANCLIMAQNNRVLQVRLDAEAQKFADDFERETTAQINRSETAVIRELWNRAHLKLLKLSALIALGINPYDPLVTLDCIQWAHILIERDVTNIFKRFESGKIGKATSESHQLEEVTDELKRYLFKPYDNRLHSYMVDPRMHADKVIPVAYLQRKLGAKASFRHDRMGSMIAIKRAIDMLVSEGTLQEVRQVDTQTRYGKIMKCYSIIDIARFTS